MVPIGFGVGDIITVTSLCFKVYRACSSASGEFNQIKNEVESLQVALAAIEEEFPNQAWLNSHTDRTQRLELQKLLDNCRDLLTSINEKLESHVKLGTPSQSRWDSLKFSKFDLKGTRSGLTAHTNALNVFLSTLNAGRLRRMESRLGKVLAEARLGRRDLSAILRQGDHNSQLADQQWKILEDELAESGFSRSDIASHRHWFENLAQVSFIAGSDTSDNTSISTYATAELPDEAETKSTPQRLYTVRHDCAAQNDDSLNVKRDDVVKCTSMLAVNVLDLDPEFVCSFKHIPSNKIVLLRVSDIQGPTNHPENSPYNSLSAFTARNVEWPSLTPSPQGFGPSALAAKSSEQIPVNPTRKSSSTSTGLKERILGETPRPTRVSTPQRKHSPAPISMSPLSQTSHKHNSRRFSATASIQSRSSSPARSIKTEASEYDADGRLVRSKIVTMTYGSEFFSRHSFALSEPDHIKRNRLKKHDRRFSLPARQQSTADADRGRQDTHASSVATSALQSDHIERHNREKHDRRISLPASQRSFLATHQSFLARQQSAILANRGRQDPYASPVATVTPESDHIRKHSLKKHDWRFHLPARQRSTADANHKRQEPQASPVAVSTKQQNTVDANHKRQDPQASPVAASTKQQSTVDTDRERQDPQASPVAASTKQQNTVDANHKRQDPQASPVAKSARSTAESVQLSQMPQSSLITLYEKRTQQLRNVMEMLRNHKVIAADPFDYPVQNIDSMNEEMNTLDIEIAASMTRRKTASKWRMSAVFTRKKENAMDTARSLIETLLDD